MSAKSEIQKARYEADLRFRAAAKPDPQAYYDKIKTRNTGIGLLASSPIGLLFFGPAGMAITAALGAITLISTLGKDQNNKK